MKKSSLVLVIACMGFFAVCMSVAAVAFFFFSPSVPAIPIRDFSVLDPSPSEINNPGSSGPLQGKNSLPPTNPQPHPQPQPQPQPQSSNARGLLEPHNAYRRTHGVPDLSWSDEIAAVAQRNVDWQSSQGVWGHQAAEAGMIPRDMGIGSENSAGGTEDLTNRWYRSPGHRENMLNPEATHMGCGLSSINLPQAICLFAKR